MSRLPPLAHLTLNRIRILFREPEALFWVFGFPILLALGIGIAFGNPQPERFRIAMEEGAIPPSLGLLLESTSEVEVVPLAGVPADELLRRGRVMLVVAADPTVPGGLVLRYDPTRPEAAHALTVVEAHLQGAAGRINPLPLRQDEIRSVGYRYIDWLIPGLIGFNLMGTGLWSVAYYTTQARENRELRRLIATPMRPRDFLLAQLLARYVFLAAEVPLIILFAWLAFGVGIQGSLLSLTLIVLVGATCFTGMGLLAASRVRTAEGVGGIVNVIMMPMLIVSGVFFSTSRFPEGAQALIALLPLTALNEALRSVYNEGAPLADSLGELGILAVWTVGSFLAALRLFRWQ